MYYSMFLFISVNCMQLLTNINQDIYILTLSAYICRKEIGHIQKAKEKSKKLRLDIYTCII